MDGITTIPAASLCLWFQPCVVSIDIIRAISCGSPRYVANSFSDTKNDAGGRRSAAVGGWVFLTLIASSPTQFPGPSRACDPCVQLAHGMKCPLLINCLVLISRLIG